MTKDPYGRQFLMRDEFYPLADYHPMKLTNSRGIAAKWTEEKRPPKKGEWYLSGAIIEAYQASNDLTTPYHIAELYEVRTVTRTITTKIRKVNHENQ